MLRPDITEAAARLTSGFDVGRELRQLGAHLREGETVHRLAAGVYGSGGGLMAVTNRRVLLLRDGRTGQASEGFPLARISSVRWVGGTGRGAVVVSDAHTTAELGQVEPTEGNSVVSFIRSLLPDEPHDEAAVEPERAAESAALDEHEGLLTHGDLVLAGGGRSRSDAVNGSTGGYVDRMINGVRNGSVNGAAGGTATATATRSGRFAVPMRVRTPPERVGLPEQKSAEPGSRVAESTGPDLSDQVHGDQDRYGLRDQVAGLDRDRYPTRDRFAGAEPVNGPAPVAGAEHVDGQARFGERDRFDGRGRSPEDLGRDDFGSGEREYPVRDLERNGHGGYPDRERSSVPGRPGTESTHDVQSSAPGMPGVEGSGALAGEVPVSRLAEETGGTRIDTAGDSDRVRRSGEYERAETSRSGHDGTGRPRAERAGYERSDPADETSELVTAVNPRRGASPRRGGTGPDGPTSSRRPGGRMVTPDRKWLLIGGAGVLTLAVIGGVIAATSGDDTPAGPAPAAIEAAGPVVKVTKVIDGDSIEVEGSTTGQVEIIGITAPRADKTQCGAADSTGFATRTLGGSQVTLIVDPGQPRLDKNGRRLASVRTADGLDYATLAAQAGMVRYYEGATPVTQATEIKAAQTEAEKAERGLWGPPCNGRTSAKSSSANSSSAGGSNSTSTSGSTGTSGSTRSSAGDSATANNASSSSAGGTASSRASSTVGAGTSTTGSNSGRGNTLTGSGLGD